jgi:hypothetical protein
MTIKSTLRGLFPTASKSGINNLVKILDPCCGPCNPCSNSSGPANFYRDVFVDPANGTTNFTLTHAPVAPETVVRGGSVLLPNEYSITGTTLTLVTPISASVGGGGSEDIMVIYPY